MHSHREYKGFQIQINAAVTGRGGYVARVMLTRHDAHTNIEARFSLPFDDDLPTEQDALQEGMKYSVDLVDGLLPWLDPRRCSTDTHSG